MSPSTKLMSSVVAKIFMMLCVACQRWQKANELLDIRFLLIEITKFIVLLFTNLSGHSSFYKTFYSNTSGHLYK